LEPVEPRAVWPSEAADFTPWLLRSPKALPDAVGMDLDLTAAEHPVGGFSLDLIGVDKATGETVIVENQLAGSDHTHLGQILTYAGGTDPVNILWLATSFREEHRAALEWLNKRTDEQTRFFAVEVGLVRIGTSAPAPLFTVVVKPNDWGKKVRASTAGPGQKWTEQDFFNGLSEQDRPAASALYEHTREAGGWCYWGSGAQASMTAQIPAAGYTLQPWTFYLAPTPGWSVNFAWIYKDGNGADEEAMERFARRLSTVPALAAAVGAARASAWRRRPTIATTAVFADPAAIDTIMAALDDLYDAAKQQDGASSEAP
jgi:hypothetical protein